MWHRNTEVQFLKEKKRAMLCTPVFFLSFPNSHQETRVSSARVLARRSRTLAALNAQPFRPCCTVHIGPGGAGWLGWRSATLELVYMLVLAVLQWGPRSLAYPRLDFSSHGLHWLGFRNCDTQFEKEHNVLGKGLYWEEVDLKSGQSPSQPDSSLSHPAEDGQNI